MVERGTVNPQVGGSTPSPPTKRISGPDQVRAELRGIWQLDDLEFDLILRGNNALAQAFLIHGGLDALFMDFAVERKWMREPKSWLDGMTPVKAMVSGRVSDVGEWLEKFSR